MPNMLYATLMHIALICLVSVFSKCITNFYIEVNGPFSAYAEGLPFISCGITTFNMLAAALQVSQSAS
jgi:hypothetical protein